MINRKPVKCVVACHNAAGEPDFYFCKVVCTAEEYYNGKHYDKAIQAAKDAGYEHQYVVFEKDDGPRWLFKHFIWPSASLVT